MNSLLKKSALVAISLILTTMATTPVYAVTVDGFLTPGEYSNSSTVEWYNWHNPTGSQFQKGDGHMTTVYWESTATFFYALLVAPLEAKNTIWGTGVTDVEKLLYYQHWCSPSSGVGTPAPLAGGAGCNHHKGGIASLNLDFKTMTGSEKVVFGDTSPIPGGKKPKPNDPVIGDLNGAASGTRYGNIVDYKDSVDYVTDPLNSLGCDMINCDASSIPMAFEFKFDAFDPATKNLFLADLNTFGVEFHLSPERGGVAPVPEPSTIALLGLGLAALAFSRKKENS